MGVVTLVDRLVHGGAERLAAEIATRLDPERFESTLCVSRWSDPGHAAVARGAGTVARRRRGSRGALPRPLTARPLGHRRLGTARPAAAQRRTCRWCTATCSDPTCGRSCSGRLTGVPVVVAHEHSWAFTGARSRQFVDRHVIGRGSDVVIACSQEDRRRMIEVEGIAAGQRAVRAERHRGAPSRPPGAACGASWGSSQTRRWSAASEPCVPRSASTCSCARPGSSAAMAWTADRHRGRGRRARARSRRLATALGLARAVMLLGARDDVPDVLDAFDVAVNCSDFEGSPLSVLEYMEAGLPVVATRVGGLPSADRRRRPRPARPATRSSVAGRRAR